MLICPACGTQNSPEVRSCVACGGGLTRPAVPHAQTIVHGGFGAPSPSNPPAFGGKQTMIGLAPAPTPPTSEPPRALAPVAGARTMLGFPAASESRPPAPDAPPRPETGARTLVGGHSLAPPLPEPVIPNATVVGGTPQAVAGARTPSNAPLPSEKKTIVGVARPGIAPLHPGVPKAPSMRPAPGKVDRAALRLAKAPPQPHAEAPAVAAAPKPIKKSGSLVVAFGAVAAAVMLLGLAAAVAVLWKSPGSIRAQVAVAPAGGEQLELLCDACVDGTTAGLGGATALFRGGRAVLPLERSLAVGKNDVTLLMSEPNAHKSREVPLTVPVEYRLRGDFSGLDEDPPKLRVLVEAVPNTSVVVDGAAIALGPDGRGRYEIDVKTALQGGAGAPQPLERKLPYAITPPGSVAERGEVVLKIGIVPLEVEAPGESITIETPNFMLAGHTLRGGAITVAGRPITVDAAGQFAQLMNVSSVGETAIVVRASAPNHAPRLVTVKVKRVQSLREEAKSFASHANSSYLSIASDTDGKRGWTVALDGEVNEFRLVGHTTIVLFEVKSGCTKGPCLVRLVHGARVSLEKGEHFTAYGHISGTVEGPVRGQPIPEVRVDFMVKDK